MDSPVFLIHVFLLSIGLGMLTGYIVRKYGKRNS